MFISSAFAISPTYFLFTFYYCHYYDYCVLLSYFLNGFKPYFHVDSHSSESCSSSSSIKEWTIKKQRNSASVCARVFLQPMKNEWFSFLFSLKYGYVFAFLDQHPNVFSVCVYSWQFQWEFPQSWALCGMHIWIACIHSLPMCSNSTEELLNFIANILCKIININFLIQWKSKYKLSNKQKKNFSFRRRKRWLLPFEREKKTPW